ncbi:MAG: sigma-54-dependent transcriptional regulator [Planctomycetota bacterium]|jgi:two-component system response regulator HydG
MPDFVPHILTVDDDPHLVALIEHNVLEWGYTHCGVNNSDQMWEEIEQKNPSIILLDITLGDTDGIALLSELKQRLPSTPVIMITVNASIEKAVKSVKSGAYDFICKPLDFERLQIEVGKAIAHYQLSLQVKAFQSAALNTDFHGMVGRSEPMRKVYRLIETVAPTDATVLLLGETGTGKELSARAIHECSNRCNGPFVPVNAPAIPHELIESALFGHEKGAFTGAHQQHLGFCEQADGGTLFLDEFCEMDYNVQAKLLRFLEDHVIQRVGAKSARKANVRVIAATNRDPIEHIKNNKLREDFYYRLSVVTVELAPLTQRPGDIALLTRYFLNIAAAKFGKKMPEIMPEAMRLLEAYSWPGNVRQLEHIIDQIIIINNVTKITPQILPQEITNTVPPGKPDADISADNLTNQAIPSISQMEKQLIIQALELNADSIPAAAKSLGLSEATLYRKIKKYQISRPSIRQQ